jgi:hypothetical protein
MLFDQPEKLQPDDVLDWHALCAAGLDCERLNVRECLLNQSPVPAYLRDALQGATSKEVDSYFLSCKQELDLAVVLTLIAAAEARIRLDARRRVEATANAGNNTLAGRLKLLRAGVNKDWAVPLYEDGILDAWKDYTATLAAIPGQDQARIRTCIGNLKNMLHVRHWVAHGRYWELRNGIGHYPPVTVAKVVTSLYKALSEAAISGGLMAFR